MNTTKKEGKHKEDEKERKYMLKNKKNPFLRRAPSGIH